MQEIDDHLKLSNREGLLSRLLAECVGSFGATCGALEIVDGGANVTKQTIGPWKGDTHLSADVRDHGNVVWRASFSVRVECVSVRSGSPRAARARGGGRWQGARPYTGSELAD
jgi:hypothetical protein